MRAKGHPRIDVKAILANPTLRRQMMVSTIIATQAREGIETTVEQAERAYDAVRAERWHPANRAKTDT